MGLDDLFKAPEESMPRARIALVGTAGSGKTYTALLMARALAAGKPVVVIDSEHGSAAKYRGVAPFRVAAPEDFAKLAGNPGKLPPVEHDPRLYTAGIVAAGKAGAGVIIIDSLSHAWQATKAHVDAVQAASRNPNSFTAWKDVTPLWDSLVSAIMSSPAHVIVTVRAKPAYVLEEREGPGGRVKQVPVKVGLAPEVRDGADHAFDIVLTLDDEHRATVSKTRMSSLDGRVMLKPGEDLGAEVLAWLESGEVAQAKQESAPAPAQDAPAESPKPSPLMEQANRLAARLPGGWDALDAYARCKDGKAARAKAGKAFGMLMAGLPEASRADLLVALEERTSVVEADGDVWPAMMEGCAADHQKAWAGALERLGVGVPPATLTTAQIVGGALYLMGL